MLAYKDIPVGVKNNLQVREGAGDCNAGSTGDNTLVQVQETLTTLP